MLSFRNYLHLGLFFMGRRSIADIAIRCRLDVPGIELRCGKTFFFFSRPVLIPTKLHLNQTIRGHDQTRKPSAEVKNEWSYTYIPPSCLDGML